MIAGEIVGKGYHHKAGQPHAEVNALAEMQGRRPVALPPM
jgi:pyrimidine deaminase RibD-like protein